MFSSLKGQPEDKPSKEYQFYFDRNDFFFVGLGSYSVDEQLDPQKSCRVKEKLMLKVGLDNILDFSKWREHYSVELTINQTPIKELLEHLDIFRINLFKNKIPFTLTTCSKSFI